jgi:hypothetical protein
MAVPSSSHHAEGLVNPKVRAQKKVTDFGYPRAETRNTRPTVSHPIM